MVAAGDGLVSMTPTSIAHSGTSASINADGGVDFTAVTELSLNGVFTGDYDNYLIVIDYVTNSAENGVRYRMRVGGSDNSTANSYVSQLLVGNGSTVSAARITDNYGLLGRVSATAASGETVHFYGPFLAQPTAVRNVNVTGQSSAYIQDNASTHNQSTSYDGFTFYLPSNDMTGTVHVFGYEE